MEPLPIRAKNEMGMAQAMLFRLGYLIGLRESVWPTWAQRFDLHLSLVKLDYRIAFLAYPHNSNPVVIKHTYINALRIRTVDDLDVTLWQLYISVKFTILRDPSETKSNDSSEGQIL